MYINSKYLHADYENPVKHFKEMIQATIEDLNETYNDNNLDYNKTLETIQCLNGFLTLNKMKTINLTSLDLLNSDNLYKALNKYYHTFLIENNHTSLHNFSSSIQTQ